MPNGGSWSKVILKGLRLSRCSKRSLSVIITRWAIAYFFDSLRHQALCGFGVAPLLNENVKHEPMTVDGAPEPVLLASDCDHDLVEMPRVAGTDRARAKTVGVIPPEFLGPTGSTSLFVLDFPWLAASALSEG
jgi:hypothetical protein